MNPAHESFGSARGAGMIDIIMRRIFYKKEFQRSREFMKSMTRRRIVLKIGTSTVTGGTKEINRPNLVDLVRQLSTLRKRGFEVILVSSGAVAAGREALQGSVFPKHVPAKQMLSAIGQPRLMAIYHELFSIYGELTAQVLLTRSDLIHRTGYLNARGTMGLLLENGVIPIVNENDAIATDEIRLGDNDTLSAHIAGLVGAEILVLMTDQDGLFDDDPGKNPSASLVRRVVEAEIPDRIWAAAGGSRSGLGTGGMLTKVRAADIARRMGTTVRIVNGAVPDCLLKVADGEDFGTTFIPTRSVRESRKRYLLSGYRADGAAVIVDRGAAEALAQGKSLLPAGVRAVVGEFDRGDTIRILDDAGAELAVGTTNYGAQDVARLVGRHADEIEEILGYSFADEMIHRDFMIDSRSRECENGN